MRRGVGVLIWTLCALLLSAAVAPAGVAGATASPGLALRVVGNQLVDADGRAVRLLGVNRSGTEFACAQGWGFFDGPTDDAAVRAIRSWHVNTVRVPLNEHCWLGINGVSDTWGGERYRTAVRDWVARLHAAGLYVVLDLHWSAPGGRLATGQAPMADADHAPAFWRSVATAFRDDPAVVFDLFNEPHDVDWACWRDGCTMPEGWRAAGMQELVDAVRSTGAVQPVLLSGRHWGGDLSQWLEHAPRDPAGQLVAGAHLYSFSQCRTTDCWDATIAPVAARVPVVTSELGQDDCGRQFTETYLDWADARGISYLPWTWNTWDCRTGPALISDYTGTPTAFGAAVRDRFAALAAAPAGAPAPQAEVALGPAQSWTQTAGRLQATTGVDGKAAVTAPTGPGQATVSVDAPAGTVVTVTVRTASGVLLRRSGGAPLTAHVVVPAGPVVVEVAGPPVLPVQVQITHPAP